MGECNPGERVGLLRGGTRPPTQPTVDYIDANKDEIRVEPICRELPIVPQT
jgi:hypothetical protein